MCNLRNAQGYSKVSLGKRSGGGWFVNRPIDDVSASSDVVASMG
jgi:hypothetical protein